ncbi:MAG TPA: zinc ribbon domain-containing protein [Gemmatimonadales bacterium]|nr:zinc ribbon domain-containing protein [Gemmatimonadales bacterium]
MALEAVVALVVAVAALWLVLQPLLDPKLPRPAPPEPLDPEETPKGIALAALKEIEFDRETGKLSDADYEYLKAKYTSAALEALRVEDVEPGFNDVEALIAARVRALHSASASTSLNTPAVACLTCGPRPEPDAVFCSTCGNRLPTGQACDRCGAPLLPESRFCETCGGLSQPVL